MAGNIDLSQGISLEEVCNWFAAVWENYERNDFFSNYKRDKGREWADEDLKALLIFLTRKPKSGGQQPFRDTSS